MWAQDAAAMYGYAGSSASATTLTPLTPPAPTTHPGGLAGQAAAVGQTTGTSTATNIQTVLSQLTSAVPTALQGLASPLPSTSAVTSGLTGILQSLGLTSPLAYAGAGLGGSELATASGAWASASDADTMIIGTHVQLADTHELIGSTLGQINSVEGQILNRLGQLGPVGAAGSAVSAGLGQATSVGALSWTSAAPTIRLAVAALPTTSLSATPTGPGSLFSEMALASMAGRAIGDTVSPGRRERLKATTGVPAALPKTSPGGPATGIAAELREVAQVLREIGALRDSGILTDEEFSEQKRRLLGR